MIQKFLLHLIPLEHMKYCSLTVLFLLLSLSSLFAQHEYLHYPPEPANVPEARFYGPTFLSYGGFKIDQTALKDNPQKETILNSLKYDIDLVNRLGLPQDILNFFYSLTIVIVFNNNTRVGGMYYEGYQSISWNGALWESDQYDMGHIVVLHELLHAFHCFKVSNGFNNTEITKFYNNAKSRSCYSWSVDDNSSYSEAATYYLTNCREFFAVTASTYLVGYSFYEEPHTRNELERQQPEYYSYLQQLFGSAGKYAGNSLEEKVENIYLEFESIL